MRDLARPSNKQPRALARSTPTLKVSILLGGYERVSVMKFASRVEGWQEMDLRNPRGG